MLMTTVHIDQDTEFIALLNMNGSCSEAAIHVSTTVHLSLDDHPRFPAAGIEAYFTQQAACSG